MTASTPATPDPRTDTLENARIEYEALGLMSYTGWQADMGKTDVESIRSLLASLAAELAATRQALERLASTESFTGAFDARHATSGVLWDELSARGQYARAVVAGEDTT